MLDPGSGSADAFLVLYSSMGIITTSPRIVLLDADPVVVADELVVVLLCVLWNKTVVFFCLLVGREDESWTKADSKESTTNNGVMVSWLLLWLFVLDDGTACPVICCIKSTPNKFDKVEYGLTTVDLGKKVLTTGEF